jgi:hypothetical protein
MEVLEASGHVVGDAGRFWCDMGSNLIVEVIALLLFILNGLKTVNKERTAMLRKLKILNFYSVAGKGRPP